MPGSTDRARNGKRHDQPTLPPLLDEVFAGVRYRGRWYWIANTDFGSKRVLSFLLSLLNLAETGKEQGLPVITILAG